MDVSFKHKKFEKQCNNFRLLQKEQGALRAKKIEQRLKLLKSSSVLADTRNFPGRCHELTGNRSGQLSLDLDHPYRLIFEPANDPVPYKEEGGLDWAKITAVKILGVVNTHD